MMKHFFLAILISCASGLLQAQTNDEKASPLEWHTDAVKAYEASKKSGKPIFAFFTGSDWCTWCHKIERDVISKPAFIEWAKKKVILLELDFPRYKQQSPELIQQNQGLQQTFQVQGYPTIWLCRMTKQEGSNQFNIDGLGSLFYPSGAEPGKEEVKFIKEADKILAKKAK